MEARTISSARAGRSIAAAVSSGIAVTLALLASPAPSRAQEPASSQPGTRSASTTHQSPDGFLFRTPRVMLGLRGGFNFARAGSEVFDLATSELTLNRADFSSFMVAGELSINLTGPLDLVLGGGYANTSKSSESRHYVDQDNLPITQRTTFSQSPLTGMLRFYLAPRGRQVGRFAWIPRKFAPYVGAGGGWTHFTFRQSGSFVDFVDLSIFDDTFESTGWTPLGLANAGADYSLGPRVVLNTDVRYQFGSGTLDRKFVDFNDGLDLNGLQVSMGVRLRF
jgi:hypothetical protein